MRKYLWFSRELTQANSDIGLMTKQEQSNVTDLQSRLRISQGYGVVIDKDLNFYQISTLNSDKKSCPKEKDCKMIAHLEEEDFDVIVSLSGRIDKNIAKKYGVKPDLASIKSKIPNFYEPRPVGPSSLSLNDSLDIKKSKRSKQ